MDDRDCHSLACNSFVFIFILMKTYIYILIDPRDESVRYVGKSNNPKKRYPQHINEAKLKNNKKANWLKSLSSKSLLPELVIIDEVDRANWQFWEQHYISLFKSWGFRLTNQTIGGGAEYDFYLNGRKQPEETKIKRAESLKKFWEGNIYSEMNEKRKSKISETVKKQSPEKWTAELKQKASESAKKKFENGYKATGGVKWKEQGKQHPQFKPFVKYDLEGNLVKEYFTVESIVEDYGKNISITHVCKGKSLIRYGNVFRYINPMNDDLPNTIESVKETIELYKKQKDNLRVRMQNVQKSRWPIE
jgi:hypothetical protein